MPAKGETPYQPLIDHLAACSEAEITLTLPMIERILGFALADSSRVNADAWTSPSHVYVRRWHALGWRARLDRSHRSVIFTHDAEEEAPPSGYPPSRYRPLLDFLDAYTGDEIVLTYEEVAAISGVARDGDPCHLLVDEQAPSPYAGVAGTGVAGPCQPYPAARPLHAGCRVGCERSVGRSRN